MEIQGTPRTKRNHSVQFDVKFGGFYKQAAEIFKVDNQCVKRCQNLSIRKILKLTSEVC